MKRQPNRPSKQELAVARIPEGGQITDWVHKSHRMAQTCGAYAVFFGAMAGQGLIRLRQVVGARNFKPTLEESMPWLARSTAYLYMGYAEKFAKRLKAICPAVGQINLKDLPDPRDWEAAEKTGLFQEAKKATNAQNWQQLLLALNLANAPKPRGGYHPKKEGEEPKSQHRRMEEHEADYYASLDGAEQEAYDIWRPIIRDLQREAFEARSFVHLAERELTELRGAVAELHKLLRRVDDQRALTPTQGIAPAAASPDGDDIFDIGGD